jgi:hypothetical protein
VRGILRDAQSGLPVKGAVRVEGFHHLVFSDPDIGDYHRLLLPGTYALWFYAPGYVPQRVTNVIVGSGLATRLDIALKPVSTRFAAKINFSPATTTLPTGFLADSGAAYGLRANGYTYGWETTLPTANLVERKAGRSRDLRYDTDCLMQTGGSHFWEISVPNGPYSVLAALGDPSYSTGTYRIAAENALLVDGSPASSNRWVEALGNVLVTDGKLTISNGAGAVSNRLAFLEISALEPTSISQWRALYFGTTNNAGNAAITADPDNDGIPNILEYSLGLNPTNHDPPQSFTPFVLQTNGNHWLAATFYRNTNALDVGFTVDAANAVPSAPWTNLVSFGGGGWSGSGNVWEIPAVSNRSKVTVMDTLPISVGSNRFLRLQVSAP